MGPAIIKAGQALSSRPDLLPSEYLDELQKLQDEVPTFSNEIAFQIVEEELGMSFDRVFELVEPEPIAAASIGQVYKARLKSNGQTVALKIQRPNTEDVVALDLYILRWWAGNFYTKIFSLLGRDINLQSVMDDFGSLLYAEIDVSDIFTYVLNVLSCKTTLVTQSICVSHPCIFCLHILNSMSRRQPMPEDSQNYMHKMLPLRMFSFPKCMLNSQRGKC